MATVSKIDSNITGLRYAEEASLGTLPASPIWHGLEPNSYADFGGSITTVARNPINPSRQRKKGVVTDLDAAGGFNADLTQENLQDILQGFFFADLRKKDDVVSAIVNAATDDFEPTATADTTTIAAGGTTYVVGETMTTTGGTGTAATFRVDEVTAGVVTAASMLTPGAYTAVPANPVSTTGGGAGDCTLTITWISGADYVAGDLICGKNFDDAANNGLHLVSGVPTAHQVICATSSLADAAAQTGQISRVGYQFASADLRIDTSGTLPTITTEAAGKDLTELELTVGEWVFIGGDTVATQFATAANNGFARVRSIAAHAIEVDKSSNTLVTDVGTGVTIQMFFGRVLKNESSTALIKRRSYNLERTLGAPDDAAPTSLQSEYMTGSVANELTLSVPSADKIAVDLGFVGTDSEQRSATTGVKSGTRPDIAEADAFNSSSDVTRIKMAVVSSTDSAPTPLFAYLTELTLTVNNNVSMNKAVGVLGAFDSTAGNFVVGGSITAYFADVAAVESVRDNDDVTIDVHLVKSNAGITVDVPLIALGNGKPNVEQDQAIMLPFDMEAATGAKIDTDLDHTLLMVFWDYLPDAAE